MTLQLLDDLRVFDYPEELAEISAAASSEASLEAMLKKVEDNWRALDFILVQYKDYKDVYVLGTTEELQVALDESNITVQTIAASRYVGPIKIRVEEWLEKLDLFSTTLVSHNN